MAYTKPKCDCGEHLIHWVQEGVTLTRKITSKGAISKRVHLERGGLSTQNLDRLQCPSCYRQYEIDEDEQGRIIRGFDWD